jgi:hypothetical protein
MITKCQTQVEERLAQVVAGDLFWAVRPQEANQSCAPVRTANFNGKINHKRANLIRFKRRYRNAIDQNLKFPQHVQSQVGHKSFPE